MAMAVQHVHLKGEDPQKTAQFYIDNLHQWPVPPQAGDRSNSALGRQERWTPPTEEETRDALGTRVTKRRSPRTASQVFGAPASHSHREGAGSGARG